MTDNTDAARTGESILAPDPNYAYRERAHLVALLAAQYNSWYDTDPDAPDWPVVYIELPTGAQLSWHISPDDWQDLFAHLDLDYGRGTWDGHTTGEKYVRIDEFTRQLHAAGALADQTAAAYPGRPGNMFQDDDGGIYVHCADGRLRLVDGQEDPYTPAGLDDERGPLLPIAGTR